MLYDNTLDVQFRKTCLLVCRLIFRFRDGVRSDPPGSVVPRNRNARWHRRWCTRNSTTAGAAAGLAVEARAHTVQCSWSPMPPSSPTNPSTCSVWGKVRQWKTTFEAFGADAKLLAQLASAFRELEDIASPELVAEIRNAR